MLAARDQENLMHGRLQVAAGKPLTQSVKTPGSRYPKTPLKIPLQDENAAGGGLGGKFMLGMKGQDLEKGNTFDQNAFVTPMGPKTRAPLGQKTTNAKAKAFQTPGNAAGPNKTQKKPTSTLRSKAKPTEKTKLQIPTKEPPLDVPEPEYAPPKAKDLPYESDVFPDGCLNYDVFKGQNFMWGWQSYHSKSDIDQDGKSRYDRKEEEGYARTAKEADEAIAKAMEDQWTVGDVPETFRHLPVKKKTGAAKAKEDTSNLILRSARSASNGVSTVIAKKAAHSLSALPSKPSAAPVCIAGPKSKQSFMSRNLSTAPPPSNAATSRHTAALATSRSTIGYSKGRSASSVLHTSNAGPSTAREGGISSKSKVEQPGKDGRQVLQRSVSIVSTKSNATVTQESWAEGEARRIAREAEENLKLRWLGVFDEGGDEEGNGIRMSEEMHAVEQDHEEFVLGFDG